MHTMWMLPEAQKRVSDPLELELQAVMSHPTGVQESILKGSATALA